MPESVARPNKRVYDVHVHRLPLAQSLVWTISTSGSCYVHCGGKSRHNTVGPIAAYTPVHSSQWEKARARAEAAGAVVRWRWVVCSFGPAVLFVVQSSLDAGATACAVHLKMLLEGFCELPMFLYLPDVEGVRVDCECCCAGCWRLCAVHCGNHLLHLHYRTYLYQYETALWFCTEAPSICPQKMRLSAQHFIS